MIVYGPKRWKYLSSFLSWVQLKMSSRGMAQANDGLAVAQRRCMKCQNTRWAVSLAGVVRASTTTDRPSRGRLRVRLSCRRNGEVSEKPPRRDRVAQLGAAVSSRMAPFNVSFVPVRGGYMSSCFRSSSLDWRTVGRVRNGDKSREGRGFSGEMKERDRKEEKER